MDPNIEGDEYGRVFTSSETVSTHININNLSLETE